jgi:hypothetical protein
MLKLLFIPFIIVYNLVLLPFKIIFYLFFPNKSNNYTRNNNIWGLSKEDKRIARQERMTEADYIEAEERDDDNLDFDD